MKAMVLQASQRPLQLEEREIRTPKCDELLIKVICCGVCRTDRHILEGELHPPTLPLILGHQIVGLVEDKGKHVQGFKKGDLVGVSWLGCTCKECEYCKKGKENLCQDAQFTGYTVDGGFAEYTTALADYCFHLPTSLSPYELAPLLCPGLIGYRCYRKVNVTKTLGLFGFGSAAEIVTDIAKYEGKEVFAFTHEGDTNTQALAKKRGAIWAGESTKPPPELLDGAIIFASSGALIPLALKAIKPGAHCVCGAIHMSDIPSFSYKNLWEERVLSSVANVTREDGDLLFSFLKTYPIKVKPTPYLLEEANQALTDLQTGRVRGPVVLDVSRG